MRARPTSILASACISLLSAWPASAQAPAGAPTAEDRALAEALFQSGKEDARAGRFEQACPKLADSLRLDPGGGTALALAHCYEARGQLASAWAAFGDALAYAQRDGRADREAEARARIAAIEPRLDRLALVVETPVPGMELHRSGQLIPASGWSSAFPIDAGEHVITAAAPGYQTFTARVLAAATGATHTVRVPALEAAPVAAPSPPLQALPPTRPPAPPRERPARPTARDEPEADSTRLAFASIGLGVGVAGLAVGSVYGLTALSKSNDADAVCPSRQCADPHAVRLSQEARQDALVSTVAFGVGALGIGAAAYLWLTSSPNGSGARVTIMPGTSGAAVSVQGTL